MHNSSSRTGDNMEQDCVVGLYRSVGRPVGEQFSVDNVSQLFGKVFHEPSNAQEVHAAIIKVSNGNSSWTCAGQNVLDVLCEMEHRRAKNEKLYWEKQLLNAMNYQSTPHETDAQFIPDSYPADAKRGILQLCTQNNILPSSNVQMNKHDWSLRKLRRAHRQSWARLVVEGLHSLLPIPQAEPALKTTSEAWGWVTLSDLLVLVEVKYDAVSSLLYTEMLRDHYTRSVWESLSPWEQRQAEEGLGNGAERALESHDLLHLAQLPGAFSVYRFQDQCWSAVSFLCEIDALCQREKSSLEGLAHRLNMENLKLLCLHIRLATVRAQRERRSYSAVVAAHQSWDTWPDVSSPRRAEQAIILLESEDKEQKVEAVSEVPQQAVLQLLVLSQEQERRQLIKLLQGLSHQEIQGLGRTQDTSAQASRGRDVDLRSACVRRLQQIYSALKTQRRCEPPLQDCVQRLLMDLLRLQEVQASALLAALVDKSLQVLLSLQEDLKSALKAQAPPNLLQLLTSDQPSVFTNHSSLPQTISCSTTHTSGGAPETDSEGSNLSGANARAHEQTTQAPREPDVCTGCGAAMAGLPYLEVLCATDLAASAEEQEAGGAPPEALPASLITLAWSKPLGSGGAEEAGDEGHGNHLQQTICGSTGGQLQYCSTEQTTHHETGTNKDENAVEAFVTQDLTSSTNSSSSEQQPVLTPENSSDVAITVETEDSQEAELKEPERSTARATERSAEPTDNEEMFSADSEGGQTMRSLVDMQRRVEKRQQRDRERQLLKVQERLSMAQNRKAEEDPLGLKDKLKLLTHDLPQEDVQQQKAVVKERLEQLRRERSCILQSKRDKNTAGFKELLGPVGLHNNKIQEDAD